MAREVENAAATSAVPTQPQAILLGALDLRERSPAPRIPFALSSDELQDLTAALASYMERQNFGASA